MPNDDEFFAGQVSDIKITKQTERDLQREIHNKFDQVKIVDAFEESQGRGKKKPKLNIRKKSYLFDMDIPEDKENYEKLINSDKYTILYFKDSFTNKGEYKMFCIYAEDLDFKEPEEKK